MQRFMHTADIPRLDADSVDPRKKAEAGGKVLEDCVFMELVLFVVFSRADFLTCDQLVEGSLVGHEHGLIPTKSAAAAEQLSLTDLLHVEKQHT